MKVTQLDDAPPAAWNWRIWWREWLSQMRMLPSTPPAVAKSWPPLSYETPLMVEVWDEISWTVLSSSTSTNQILDAEVPTTNDPPEDSEANEVMKPASTLIGLRASYNPVSYTQKCTSFSPQNTIWEPTHWRC